MLITSYQENSTSLSESFLNYTGKSSLFQSNKIGEEYIYTPCNRFDGLEKGGL